MWQLIVTFGAKFSVAAVWTLLNRLLRWISDVMIVAGWNNFSHNFKIKNKKAED